MPTGQPHSVDNILKKLGQYDDYTFGVPEPEPVTKLEPRCTHIQAAFSETNASALSTTYASNIKETGLTPRFLNVIDDAAQYARVTAFVQKCRICLCRRRVCRA